MDAVSMIGRRGFITGLISLIAAPAIVRAGSLMPVRGEVAAIWDGLPVLQFRGINEEFYGPALRDAVPGFYQLSEMQFSGFNINQMTLVDAQIITPKMMLEANALLTEMPII